MSFEILSQFISPLANAMGHDEVIFQQGISSMYFSAISQAKPRHVHHAVDLSPTFTFKAVDREMALWHTST